MVSLYGVARIAVSVAFQRVCEFGRLRWFGCFGTGILLAEVNYLPGRFLMVSRLCKHNALVSPGSSMSDEKSGVASECWFRCVDCQGWDLLLAVLRGRGPQASGANMPVGESMIGAGILIVLHWPPDILPRFPL